MTKGRPMAAPFRSSLLRFAVLRPLPRDESKLRKDQYHASCRRHLALQITRLSSKSRSLASLGMTIGCHSERSEESALRTANGLFAVRHPDVLDLRRLAQELASFPVARVEPAAALPP